METVEYKNAELPIIKDYDITVLDEKVVEVVGIDKQFTVALVDTKDRKAYEYTVPAELNRENGFFIIESAKYKMIRDFDINKLGGKKFILDAPNSGEKKGLVVLIDDIEKTMYELSPSVK
jgi:hypothetical protein